MSVRLAFVGLGWVVRQVWMPQFIAHGAFEMVAAVDTDPAAADAAAAAWPGLPVVRDLEEVIGGRPDLVVIATPNRLHVPIASALLEKGINVLVEKPVCLDFDEVNRLRVAAEKGKSRIFASRASRLRADVMTLVGLVEAGRLGEIRLVEATWVRARGIPRPGGWFTNRALAGGGVGVDLGWHMLSVGLSLLGFPRVDRAAALMLSDHLGVGSSSAADWRGDGAGGGARDVEDTVHALATMTDGRAIHLHVAWASQKALDVTRVTVHGSRALAALTTTFGFSPNRVGEPSLVVTEAGHETPVPLLREPIGAEYGRQVALLADEIGSPGADDDFVEIEAVVRALQAIYSAAERAS